MALLDHTGQAPFFAECRSSRGRLDELKALASGPAVSVMPLSQQQQQQNQPDGKIIDSKYTQVIGTAGNLQAEKYLHVDTVQVDDVTTAVSAPKVAGTWDRHEAAGVLGFRN